MSEATKVVEPVLDAASEAILEGVDGVVDVVQVVRNNPIALVAVGAVALAAGGVGGYFFAKKKLTKVYEELATEEIAQAKSFYANLNKVDEDGAVLTPQDVMEQRHGSEAAAAALRIYAGDVEAPKATEEELDYPVGTPHDDLVDEQQLQKIERSIVGIKRDADGTLSTIQEETVETTNIFSDQSFDYDEEVKHRTDDKPYIITHDEYFAAEKDYDTISLTYFETDDTLVDEKDVPLDTPDDTVGEDHLVMFGRGSQDRNIVYVRNDKLQVDFEITKSKGSYLEEVLGMPDEEPNSLKHSDQGRQRRAFRHGDE